MPGGCAHRPGRPHALGVRLGPVTPLGGPVRIGGRDGRHRMTQGGGSGEHHLVEHGRRPRDRAQVGVGLGVADDQPGAAALFAQDRGQLGAADGVQADQRRRQSGHE
ncbi:MAG: hypothetical protein QM708_10580 [Propioniciclava sp.]